MKKNKNEKKIKNKGAKKQYFLNGALLLALFGVTATTTFLLLPEKTLGGGDDTGETEDEDIGDDIKPITGVQRFISNLTNSATAGLNLSFDTLDLYFPGKDKSDKSKGNLINASGTEVTFSMEEASLHGISLGLKAKVDYNGCKRSLNLLKETEDIYFSINDDDNQTYDFKYKASIKAKVTEERDETTGGLIQYEYGDIDWIIQDILEILSSGNINVTFPKIDLGGSSDSSSSSSTSSDAVSDILDSLSNMEEDAPHKYFVWNLPLGEETLPIGLSRDDDYNLAGIDFPAKSFSGDASSQEVYSLKNEGEEVMTIQASAKVKTGSDSVNWLSFLTADPSEYHSIVDSASLFRKVARYAANPQFGLTTTNSLSVNSGEGLVLTHYKTEDDKTVGSDVIEQASLYLSGNADFTGGLQAFNLDLALSADASKAAISAAYIDNEAFMNIDDLLMAKVSKTNLDALWGDVTSSVSSTSSVSESMSEIEGAQDLIETVLNNYPTIKSFAEGHYEGAFDFIKSIKGENNKIVVTFDLTPLQMDGEISLTIDGTYSGDSENASTDTYLSNITFKSVKLSAFELDGTVSLSSYAVPSLDKTQYDELTHLPGIKDQITSITSSKEAGLSLSGSIKTGKQDKVGQDIGVNFDSDIAFSYDKKQAGITLTANQISKEYSQDHHFDFSLDGDGENFTNAAFRYDSVNDATVDSETGLDEKGKSRTNPRSSKPLTGTMSVSSMQDIVSTVKKMIPEEEDDGKTSFQKIASSIGSLVGNNLADSLINNKFFGFAEKKILVEKASLGGDSNTFKLNGELFGMDENPLITVSYQPNEESSNGGFKSLTFQTSKVSLSLGLDKTNGLTEAELNPLKGEDLSAYTNFNTLKTLVEYIEGSTKLGQVVSGDASVYDVSLNLSLNIGKTTIDLFGVSLHVANEKDVLKAHLSIPFMPLIKGVNAPDNSIYFRDHEYEGKRSVDLYYSYAKGDEDFGDVYITRDSSYGRITQVRDTVQLKGKDFAEKSSSDSYTYSYNGIGWLLEYVLGVNESYLAKDNAPTDTETMEAQVEDGTSLFDARFPHPEDFLKKYAFDSDQTKWSMGVDVGSLLDERGLLGDATLSILGSNVANSDSTASWKTISSMALTFGLKLGNPDGTGQIVPASIALNLSLDNVSSGVYKNTWSDAAVNDFTSVVSYGEDGTTNFTYGDSYTKHYASEDSALLPGNYYVGVTC